ncbi:hypothetical protein ACWC5I_15035 [Kitasatospora sp. NPDC001574]
MNSNDTTTYIDHAGLAPADYADFEQLLAAPPGSRPAAASRWHLFLTQQNSSGQQWISSSALFVPAAAADHYKPPVARVYFDEDGRALPDRPERAVPRSPFADRLAEQLPGWSVRPCPLNPGRDLDELADRAWGWGRTSWTTTTAPDTALALTGPEGEYLLAVRTAPDAPLLVGAARPADLPLFALGEVAPPAPVPVAAGRARQRQRPPSGTSHRAADRPSGAPARLPSPTPSSASGTWRRTGSPHPAARADGGDSPRATARKKPATAPPGATSRPSSPR